MPTKSFTGLLVLCLYGCGANADGPGQNAEPGSAGGAGLETGGTTGAGGASAMTGSGGGASPGGTPVTSSGGAASGGVSSAGGAGTGGIAGSGGIQGSGGTSAGCERSTVTADQVVFIGDSFLALPTSYIAIDLEQIWQKVGSPGYSDSPRYHQLVGTTMAQIAAQYDTAHSQNPDIKVVIADGGGNDVLVTDRSCLVQAPPANTGCAQTIANAVSQADQLLTKMEADGVEHVMYSFYPHEPTSGLYQGVAPTINDSLDYAEPLARAACEKHSICTFVSFREATGDSAGSGYTERGYINANDVHPSSTGSQFFAEYEWSLMQDNCVLSP